MSGKNNIRRLIFNITLKFAFIAGCLCAAGSCSSNKYDGNYSGKLTAQTKFLNVDGSVADRTTEEEKDLVISIDENGSDVFVSISGSRLLGDCTLKANSGAKDRGASIDDPQSCDSSLPLTGSISLLRDEITISLSGFSKLETQNFEYVGEKK